MFVSQKLRLLYCQIPKVASSSIIDWLYELAFFENSTADFHQLRVREFIRNRRDPALFIAKDVQVPHDYFCFCVVRDPVKRFISGYHNRVVEMGELQADRPFVNKLLHKGHPADPDINHLALNLQAYFRVPAIKHHFRPMHKFIGSQAGRLRYYTLSELDRLHRDVALHLGEIGYRSFPRGPEAADRLLPIPKRNSTKVSLPLRSLTVESLEALLQFYAEDYRTVPHISDRQIRLEWANSVA